VNKTGARERYPKRLVIAGLFVALLLVVLGFYPPLFKQVVMAPPMWLVRESLVVFRGTQISVVSGWEYFSNLWDAEKENQALKKEVALLSARLEKSRGLFYENARLKALLGLKSRISAPGRPCRVLADNPTVGHRTILLDCGSKDGIRVKDGVLGPSGVVGFVVKVFPGFSQVLWIEDAFFAMEGLLPRSGQKGIVEGRGVGRALALNYIPILTPVQKGEMIVTSGEDGYFPPGERIGVVRTVTPDTDLLFHHVEFLPAESLSELDVAYVLTPEKNWVQYHLQWGSAK
jgi:rod shape-determining protein MreC